MAEASFKCPRCGETQHNANEARQGYCGACKGWTKQRGRQAYVQLPTYETENEWLVRIRDGDKDAFTALFRTYYNRLCVYVEGFIRNPATAEDLVEEIFTYLWRNRHRANPIIALRKYLYRAAHNRALKYLRDNRKWGDPPEAEDEEDEVWFGYSSAMGEGSYIATDARIVASELHTIVTGVIASLPGRQREAFLLQRQHGLTHAEIAETMGISISTVEKHVLAAAKKLSAIVRERYGLTGDHNSAKDVVLNIDELESYID